MATIRAYTTIEQSHKLAEILPIESADMLWANDNDVFVVPYDLVTRENILHAFIPCWSLASLLGVLPDELEDNHFLTLDKEGKEYCCCYEDGNGNSFKHKFADNPIDACVAMIEHLHELKIL